jgi:hypothetical protein
LFFIISLKFASVDAIIIVLDESFGQNQIDGLIMYLKQEILGDNHPLLSQSTGSREKMTPWVQEGKGLTKFVSL